MRAKTSLIRANRHTDAAKQGTVMFRSSLHPTVNTVYYPCDTASGRPSMYCSPSAVDGRLPYLCNGCRQRSSCGRSCIGRRQCARGDDGGMPHLCIVQSSLPLWSSMPKRTSARTQRHLLPASAQAACRYHDRCVEIIQK